MTADRRATMPPSFALGMQIVFSDAALDATNERLFPASKHRSRRVHKKLVKRFGGEFRKRPCMWRMGDKIIAHPSFRAEVLEEAARVVTGHYQELCTEHRLLLVNRAAAIRALKGGA